MTALEARLGGVAIVDQAPVASTNEDDFDLFGSDEVRVLGGETYHVPLHALPCGRKMKRRHNERRNGG